MEKRKERGLRIIFYQARISIWRVRACFIRKKENSGKDYVVSTDQLVILLQKYKKADVNYRFKYKKWLEKGFSIQHLCAILKDNVLLCDLKNILEDK